MDISTEQFGRVFRIRTSAGVASCFLFHTDKGSLFISAQHCLKGSRPGDKIFFQRNGKWIKTEITNIAFDGNRNDSCAFTTSGGVEPSPATKWGGKTIFGEKHLFFGFPLGLECNANIDGFPIPLCRTAHFSGVVEINGVTVVVLDGFNNSGYSGGPVFHASGPFELTGIISGYHYDSNYPVYKKNESGNQIDTGQFVKPNSGLIYVTPIKCIVDLVNEFDRWNPVPIKLNK